MSVAAVVIGDEDEGRRFWSATVFCGEDQRDMRGYLWDDPDTIYKNVTVLTIDGMKGEQRWLTANHLAAVLMTVGGIIRGPKEKT